MRIALLLAAATVAAAQAPNLKTASGYSRSVQARARSYVERSAEKMPAEWYDFKPVPEVRSFAAILGHIADAEYLFCSAALGEKNPSPGIEKTIHTKPELVKAVQAAFAYCAQAYANLTDADAAVVVKSAGGAGRNKLGMLWFNSTHTYEHYGNLVTYMRLKGILPPSSERNP